MRSGRMSAASEDEFARLAESRQYRRGCIEKRPFADLRADPFVKPGLSRAARHDDGNQPPAIVELFFQRFRNLFNPAGNQDRVEWPLAGKPVDEFSLQNGGIASREDGATDE